MKEIKFRAWDKKEKVMLYNIQSYLEHKDKNGNEYDGYFDWKFDDFIIDPNIKIMQFTGLRDKNNKEIYQDDIIKYSYNHCECGKFKSYNLKVSFGSLGARMGGDLICDPLYKEKDIEVIGNIYENSELI